MVCLISQYITQIMKPYRLERLLDTRETLEFFLQINVFNKNGINLWFSVHDNVQKKISEIIFNEDKNRTITDTMQYIATRKLVCLCSVHPFCIIRFNEQSPSGLNWKVNNNNTRKLRNQFKSIMSFGLI